MSRKTRDSKYYVLKPVGDDFVLFPVTDDLTDKELQRHFTAAIESEDYDYADAIKAEAESRHITLKVKI